MDKPVVKSEERIIPDKIATTDDLLIYLRHLFAYEYAKNVLTCNSQVIEIGCGEGYGTSILSQYCKEIIGLDVEDNIIAHATKKYASNNCLFKTYDGIKLPFENNACDAVISFQTIEHVEKDIDFISESHRVLKNDGILILTTPNRLNRLKPGQKPWNRFHVREYSPDDLNNILKTIFKEVSIMGISGYGEVQNIELKRVKRNRDFAQYDLFNLKKHMPSTIKNSLKGVINYSRKNDKKNIANFTTDDFFVSQNELNNCLDVMAICVK